MGHIVGVGPSDPSTLTVAYGWSVNTLVSRYMGLAWLCIVVLGVVYAAGLVRAHAWRHSSAARLRNLL